jgi:excisionase family DNA binding protein
MPENKDFITVTELAAKLGVTRGAIHKRIKKGQIQVKRIGNVFVVPASEYEGLISKELTRKDKTEIEESVAKVVKEYGETLKLLGKE